MQGCRSLVDSIVTLSATAEASGFARVYLPFRDAPAFFGDVYLQSLWFEPNANALGLVTGRGIRIAVR